MLRNSIPTYLVGMAQTELKRFNERDSPKVPPEDIVLMIDFFHKNNFFEFNGDVKLQKSGTAYWHKICTSLCLHFHGYTQRQNFQNAKNKRTIYLYGEDKLTFYSINAITFILKLTISRMNEWFLARRNPERVVNDQINKVVCDKNQPVKKTSESGISFVPTHQLRLQSLVY